MQNADRLKRFLVAARARIDPEAVGFPRLGRRRVAGLRREEVAELAGVSSVWYSRFEAGRARLSMKALRALANALRLTPRETSDLFALAFPELPTHERDLHDPLLRAEAGILRIGALDLPMAQPEMLRGLSAITQRGFRIAQDPASWLEQDDLLEAGQIDVATSYRFAHAEQAVDLDEHFVCEEVSTKVALAPGRFTKGTLSIHEMTGARLSAPSGRMMHDLMVSAKHEGFRVEHSAMSTSATELFRDTLAQNTFAFVTDDYGQFMAQQGLDVRSVHDIAITSHLVFRTRKGDTNPAVLALREVLCS